MLILETIFLAATLAASPQGCGSSGHPHGGHGQAEPTRPKVKATNTLCPVMGQPVKPGRDREVIVRGGFYLVCCDDCGPKMAETPDKYLEQDGRPKNAQEEAPNPKGDEPASPSEHKH